MSNINTNSAASPVANRVILITGASSGIGEATTRLLADQDAKVAISQPADVDVNEMIVRSVRSAGHAF